MILKTTKLSLVKSPKKRMTVKMSKNPKNAVMALKNLA